MGGPPHPPLRTAHRDAFVSGGGPQRGSDGKIVHSTYSRTTTKHYSSGCLFPQCSASFHPFLHYTVNKNAMEITEVRLLPHSLDNQRVHNELKSSSASGGQNRVIVQKITGEDGQTRKFDSHVGQNIHTAVQFNSGAPLARFCLSGNQR